MGEQTAQPEFQRVVDDLRAQIASGDLAVGAPIPSTAELKEQHDVSVTVVRRAVAELKEEGLLQGQPGKGVYVQVGADDVAEAEPNGAGQNDAVQAEPNDVVQGEPKDVPTAHSEEFQAIMREIREIRGQMEGMNERLDDGSQDQAQAQDQDQEQGQEQGRLEEASGEVASS